MKNKAGKTFLSLFLFGLVLVAAGCATTSSNTASEPIRNLTVSTALRFDDVPVPQGFSQLPKESFIFQTESVRAGVVRYAGNASPEAVMQFYKQQMPAFNWSPVNIIEFGQKQLSFEKPGQTCVVVVEGTRSKSTITISIGPKSEKPKSLIK